MVFNQVLCRIRPANRVIQVVRQQQRPAGMAGNAAPHGRQAFGGMLAHRHRVRVGLLIHRSV